jgi:hypothetical protein
VRRKHYPGFEALYQGRTPSIERRGHRERRGVAGGTERPRTIRLAASMAGVNHGWPLFHLRRDAPPGADASSQMNARAVLPVIGLMKVSGAKAACNRRFCRLTWRGSYLRYPGRTYLRPDSGSRRPGLQAPHARPVRVRRASGPDPVRPVIRAIGSACAPRSKERCAAHATVPTRSPLGPEFGPSVRVRIIPPSLMADPGQEKR